MLLIMNINNKDSKQVTVRRAFCALLLGLALAFAGCYVEPGAAVVAPGPDVVVEGPPVVVGPPVVFVGPRYYRR